MPYQVLGASSGAADLMMAWIFFAIARSDGVIALIFSRTSAASSAALALRRRSLTSSFIAAFSSAVIPEPAFFAFVVVAMVVLPVVCDRDASGWRAPWLLETCPISELQLLDVA